MNNEKQPPMSMMFIAAASEELGTELSEGFRTVASRNDAFQVYTAEDVVEFNLDGNTVPGNKIRDLGPKSKFEIPDELMAEAFESLVAAVESESRGEPRILVFSGILWSERLVRLIARHLCHPVMAYLPNEGDADPLSSLSSLSYAESVHRASLAFRDYSGLPGYAFEIIDTPDLRMQVLELIRLVQLPWRGSEGARHDLRRQWNRRADSLAGAHRRTSASQEQERALAGVKTMLEFSSSHDWKVKEGDTLTCTA